MKLRIPDPKASALVKFHLTMALLWILAGIPTILYWKESILWVAFMSLWANIVGHFGAWDAARAEQAAEDS